MEKTFMKRVAMTMCAALFAASLTACVPSPKKEAPPKPEPQEQKADVQPDNKPDAKPDAKADDKPQSGKYESVEAFLASPMIQKQLNTTELNTPGSGIVMEIVGEGDTLVYLATIEDDALAQAMDETALAAGLETMTQYYTSLASVLRATVDVSDPAVEVRYVNNAGDVLYSQVFKAAAV